MYAIAIGLVIPLPSYCDTVRAVLSQMFNGHFVPNVERRDEEGTFSMCSGIVGLLWDIKFHQVSSSTRCTLTLQCHISHNIKDQEESLTKLLQVCIVLYKV